MEKYKCEFCEKEFENSKIKANHVRWKHKYVEVYYSDKKKWIENLINAVYIENMKLVKFY